MDGVAPAEIDRVVHALRVVARLTQVEAELAPDGRGRRGAGRDVEGVDGRVALDQGHHLAGDVDLDVAAVRVARLERAPAHQQLAEDRTAVGEGAGHIVCLAESLDRKPGADRDPRALGPGVVALRLERPVEEAGHGALAELLRQVHGERGLVPVAGDLGLDHVAAAGRDLERHLERAVGLRVDLLVEDPAAAGADRDEDVVAGQRTGQLSLDDHLLEDVDPVGVALDADLDPRGGGLGAGLGGLGPGCREGKRKGRAPRQQHQSCPAPGIHRSGIVADA